MTNTFKSSQVIQGTDYTKSTLCVKCGTGLKHWFEVDGNKYGSECIKSIIGMTGEEAIEEINKQERIKKIEASKADDNKAIEELNKKKEIFTPKNKWLIDFLIEVDKVERWSEEKQQTFTVQQEGFTYNLAQELETKSLADLTDNQYNSICDIVEAQKLPLLKQLAKQKGLTKLAGMKKDDILDYLLEEE
ncbi:hypothetical protein AAXE64_08415 [Priestia megaterium]